MSSSGGCNRVTIYNIIFIVFEPSEHFEPLFLGVGIGRVSLRLLGAGIGRASSRILTKFWSSLIVIPDSNRRTSSLRLFIILLLYIKSSLVRLFKPAMSYFLLLADWLEHSYFF